MNNPMFPLISALSGYRLIVIDEKRMPGITENDIMISRTLYNKMKEMCPDLFKDINPASQRDGGKMTLEDAWKHIKFQNSRFISSIGIYEFINGEEFKNPKHDTIMNRGGSMTFYEFKAIYEKWLKEQEAK